MKAIKTSFFGGGGIMKGNEMTLEGTHLAMGMHSDFRQQQVYISHLSEHTSSFSSGRNKELLATSEPLGMPLLDACVLLPRPLSVDRRLALLDLPPRPPPFRPLPLPRPRPPPPLPVFFPDDGVDDIFRPTPSSSGR